MGVATPTWGSGEVPEVWESIYQIYSTGGKEDAFNLDIDELEANFAEVGRSPNGGCPPGPPLEVNG